MNAKELIGKTISDAALWRIPEGVTGDIYLGLWFTDGTACHIEANSFQNCDFVTIYPGFPAEGLSMERVDKWVLGK